MDKPAPPHVFALAPGVDFPAELVAGLLARMQHEPPEAMARLTLYLNTQRMRRRVAQILSQAGHRFLPKLRLVSEIGADPTLVSFAAPPSPLRRRLEICVLLDAILKAQPDMFARASLYELADSLAGLLDEMQGEGISATAVCALNTADYSAHWARTQQFLQIVSKTFAADAPDVEARQRLAVEAMIQRWQTTPPTDPVIVAGSTGSRGTTALLMQAVARLPNGSVVLPGFDFDMPKPVWAAMDGSFTAEDHPQFRFRRLLLDLDLSLEAIRPWTLTGPPAPQRNQVVSLSLRPAPVTDQWLSEGPGLPDLVAATGGITLIEAPTERAEALSIALVLRKAAQSGTTAALVTPDRNLTRRVASALDRWGIRPDDSAGKPLALSAPGRFLRQIAAVFGSRTPADALLALLKHPMCFSQEQRGVHLLLTRDLELELRRNGPAFPTGKRLSDWAKARPDAQANAWAAIISETILGLQDISSAPLCDHVATLRKAAERLSRGFAADGTGELWRKKAGEEALAAIEDIARDAPVNYTMAPPEFSALLGSVLHSREVREPVQAQSGIMIWGTLEARVQGAELVVLGGLNEGIWPAQPPADPWLNRQMRKDVGLLLPDRRIGLSAHDYQQAVAAKQVVLTRPLRNADSETIASRWLNRLTNLLDGLPMRSGPEALQDMRGRGAEWLGLATALETPVARSPASKRPSPRPPVAARPKELSLTRIERLIRDPFAIYARYILRLKKLDTLRKEADPRLRGEVLHAILESFVRETALGDKPATRQTLLSIADQILADRVAFPTARAIWRARLDRAADAFLAFSRTTGGVPVLIEKAGRVALDGLDFTLSGTPDRIDLLPDGSLHLIDYKTGAPPGKDKQKHFEKQLLLAAAMAENGGFAGLGPRAVSAITYVGIKDDLKKEETPMTPELVSEIWADLGKLIARYEKPGQGYTSRRAMFETKITGDYDHLARFGEWDLSDLAIAEDIP